MVPLGFPAGSVVAGVSVTVVSVAAADAVAPFLLVALRRFLGLGLLAGVALRYTDQ